MFKKFLEKISNIKTLEFYYWSMQVKNIYLNRDIFENWVPDDLEYHKSKFIKRLQLKKVRLKILKLEISEKNLELRERDLLFNEINYRIAKINFLIKVYDIEVDKMLKIYSVQLNNILDNKLEEINIDYSKYNKRFFWLTKKTLSKKIIEDFSEVINYDLYFSKDKLIELIEFSKNILPKEIEFIFWDFSNLAHNSWKLKIPNKRKYWIKFIITLFFHEMTHFFRNYNQRINFWFDYNFSDYTDLEEWIALYNEYLYWNQIIKIWHYIPYYDMCYITLLQDIPEEQKKIEIYNILKYKGYSKSKSLSYYYRFYKFAKIWSKDLFLKDLIYTKWYKNVLNLIRKNPLNYNKIMAWNIWLKELKSNLLEPKYNFGEKLYFEKMVEKIKSMI